MKVHHIGGFYADKAKKAVKLPSGFKVIVILAVGYENKSRKTFEYLSPMLKDRILSKRTRKPSHKNFYFGQYRKLS